MEHVVTSAAATAATSIAEVVGEPPAPTPERTPTREQDRQQRRRRLIELREAIQRGEYRVSASHVADALIRAARRAN